MSEAPQGDGWWLATDGRWYPPPEPVLDTAGSAAAVRSEVPSTTTPRVSAATSPRLRVQPATADERMAVRELGRNGLSGFLGVVAWINAVICVLLAVVLLDGDAPLAAVAVVLVGAFQCAILFAVADILTFGLASALFSLRVRRDMQLSAREPLSPE